MTESTCCCVSMPAGPSFKVAVSIAGPPAMRSGSHAVSISRVMDTVELGLMTRIVALMLPLNCGRDYSGSGRRTLHEFETRPGRAGRRARARRRARIRAVGGTRTEVRRHAAHLPPRQPAQRLDP